MRIVRLLDTVGTVLILQLLFAVLSLGLVTAVPAAVALQRQFTDALLGEATGTVSFLRAFTRAWWQCWLLGIVGPVLTAGFVVSIAFWSSVPGPPGIAALGVLVFLAGLTSTIYLALLGAAGRQRDQAWRAWFTVALAHLVTVPLRGLWATILFLCWLVTLAYLPTLWLVGSGLVPAVIVRYTLAFPGSPELPLDDQASRP